MVGWYDVGLGEWVEDNEHRKKIAKSKGLEEVSSIEEVGRYTKDNSIKEEEMRDIVLDSLLRMKYCKYTQWKVKQEEKIRNWKKHLEAYERGDYTFSSINR